MVASAMPFTRFSGAAVALALLSSSDLRQNYRFQCAKLLISQVDR
jgi:hypothetical protein